MRGYCGVSIVCLEPTAKLHVDPEQFDEYSNVGRQVNQLVANA